MWMKSKAIQKLGGGPLEQFGIRLWSRLQMTALDSHKDSDVVKMLWSMQKERRTLMSGFEAYTVYSIAKGMAKRPGAFAEVGAFRGASAKLICEVKGEKMFHVFDTFEGLPEPGENDRGVHKKGQYTCSLESVKQYLEGYENVHFHKGVFPDSAAGVADEQYAFAHFDVDLYEGTRACLEYFYPRMIPGGVMLTHDFSILAGVEKAFTEFFDDKPEGVIQFPTTQCMAIKV